MRRYRIAVVTLLGAGAVLGQENIVPGNPLDNAVRRAVAAPAFSLMNPTPVKPPIQQTFNLMKASPNICAIPLLHARVPGTLDKNNVKSPAHVDPKMATHPAIPACPSH